MTSNILILALLGSLAAAFNTTNFTPCSYREWLDAFPPCMRPCYAQDWYKTTIGPACGGWTPSVVNSTQKKDIECICDQYYLPGGIPDGAIAKAQDCMYDRCTVNVSDLVLVSENFQNWVKFCAYARDQGIPKCTNGGSVSYSPAGQAMGFAGVLSIVLSLFSVAV